MRVSWFYIVLGGLAISGCTSYPEEMSELKKQITLDCAAVEYRVCGTDGGDRLLALEERGRLCQLKGDWRGSSKEYEAAMNHVFYVQEIKPVINANDALKDAIASTYGNELAKDYAPSAFEQMMLHTLDAFNRLALGEWDNFSVNIRNLETWRNEAAELIDKNAEALSKGGVTTGGTTASNAFKLNAVQRSTDNIYALYLIGLYREMLDDPSNACIAYRDIERIRHGTATVKDVLKQLNSTLPPDEGEVVVFLEEGFIPPKRECKFYVDGIVSSISSATPTYSALDCMPYEDGCPLMVRENGIKIAQTQFLCDLAPLAAKSLDECMGGIIARQIARTGVKAATQGALSAVAIGAGAMAASGRNGGAAIAIAGAATLGSIAMGIYSEASERADLRSWLLLPRQVQIARFPMKAGKHKLSLSTAGMKEDVVAEVKPGAKTIIHCTAVPNVMKAFAVCTDKVK